MYNKNISSSRPIWTIDGRVATDNSAKARIITMLLAFLSTFVPNFFETQFIFHISLHAPF